MECGIYKITNTVNSMMYIGASALSKDAAFSIQRRWEGHQKCARRGLQKVLYDAMREYGIENFTCEMVEECPDQIAMYIREAELIKELNTMFPNGYNKNKGRYTGKQNKRKRVLRESTELSKTRC